MKNAFNLLNLKVLIALLVITLFANIPEKAISQSGLWTWVHGPATATNAIYGIKGVADSSNVPTALYSCVYWKDKQGRFWIYGGKTSTNDGLSDMWMFDPMTSMWTWVYGKQLLDEIPRWNSQGVPDTSNCPGARGYGSPAWTDSTGNLWMFGGHAKKSNAGYAYMNDLWKYDINSNIWTWMKGDTTGSLGNPGTMGVPDSLNNPQSLAQTTVAWTDNQDNLYFFGGHAGIYGNLNFRVFRYNISTNVWTWIPRLGYNAGTKGVFSPTNAPSGRAIHSSWVDNTGHIWMYGGMGKLSYCCYYNQLWQYDPLINQWAWMSGDSLGGEEQLNNAGQICQPADTTNPDNSIGANAVWTDNDGNLWMYGGRTEASSSPTYNTATMWCWLQSKQQWMYTYSPTLSAYSRNFQPVYGTMGIPDPNNHPGNRRSTAAWKDNNGNFWMWGGLVETSPYEFTKNDMWMYSPDTACLRIAGVSNDEYINSLIEIFPNPVADKLYINNLSHKHISKAEIINLQGSMILSKNISQNQELNISEIPIGLYIIKLDTKEGEYYTKKIMISR